MFKTDNPEWKKALDTLLTRVHAELGVTENATISAEIYKLLLYPHTLKVIGNDSFSLKKIIIGMKMEGSFFLTEIQKKKITCLLPL